MRMNIVKNILHLNLHREFFAQIAAGTKRTEYRELKPYWKKRLENRKYDVIQFRNGYYAIRLGRILKIKRWKTKPEHPIKTYGHEK